LIRIQQQSKGLVHRCGIVALNQCLYAFFVHFYVLASMGVRSSLKV
jgi:hypothetical protein